MADVDPFADFLTTVSELHDSDTQIRTTAHTSSVSAEGWPSNDEEPASTQQH